MCCVRVCVCVCVCLCGATAPAFLSKNLESEMHELLQVAEEELEREHYRLVEFQVCVEQYLY
jgi:hypothetical protein